VLVAEKMKPQAQTLHFVLSILAIVPLAALLSHATESVAAKTGDSVGGLLNSTLGNLTELSPEQEDASLRSATAQRRAWP
jgi:Ca2+:H+ antiporter